MKLLVSEILPTSVMPDRLAPWMDDLSEYVPVVTAEDEHPDDRAHAPGRRRPGWSDLLLSPRWAAFIDMF